METKDRIILAVIIVIMGYIFFMKGIYPYFM